MGDVALRTGLSVEIRGIDDPSRVISFVGVSDQAAARDGIYLVPRGAQLENYSRNPVFLWAHDYKQPVIGRTVSIHVQDEAIHFDVEFANRDVNPFAEIVYQLYRRRFQRAVSVAWITLEREIEELPDGGRRMRITKWDLLELSAVAVPADPGAVSLAGLEDLDRELIARAIIPADRQPRGAVPYDGTPKAPEGRPWSGQAAEARLRRWAGGPDPKEIDWEKYRRGFAWYDDSKPQIFGSYKLPHHDVIDGELHVVWSGVSAAMAALLGARGGTNIPDGDRRRVYGHLARHYDQFNKQPPDFRQHAEEEIADLVQAPADDDPDRLIGRVAELEASVAELEGAFFEIVAKAKETVKQPTALSPDKLAAVVQSAIERVIARAKGRLVE